MNDPLLIDLAKHDALAFSQLLRRGSDDEVLDVLRQLPADLAASVGVHLPIARLAQLVNLRPEVFSEWLEAAALDDAVALLARLPRDRGVALVKALENGERKGRLRQIQQYPKHCVGAILKTIPLQVREEATADEVLSEIRAAEGQVDLPAIVVDGSGRIGGKLDLWKVLQKDAHSGHARDYVSPTPTLRPEASLASVSESPHWRGHVWLPVVDHQQRVLGYVTEEGVAQAASEFREAGSLLAKAVENLGSQFFRIGTDLLTAIVARRSSP